PLTVDGSPPAVSIASPAEGASLTGSFALTANASDDVTVPLAIEIYVAGGLAGTAIGPSSTTYFSADGLVTGPAEIIVVAIDEAGNRSVPAKINVTFGVP